MVTSARESRRCNLALNSPSEMHRVSRDVQYDHKVPTARRRRRGCRRNHIAWTIKDDNPSRRSRPRKKRERERSFLQSPVKAIEKSGYTRDPGTIPKRVIKRHDRANPRHAAFPSQPFVPSSRHGLYPLSLSLPPPAPSSPLPFFSSPRRVLFSCL